MDRLTTGRRHARAGSVTVTELLVKQASPALCTDSSPTERDDITEFIPVIAPASHRRHPARGAHFAKLASIGVAGAVLCGAVSVASVISQHRRENTRQTQPAVQITGDEALLPDRLDRTLPEPTTQATPPPAVSPAAQDAPEPGTPSSPAPVTPADSGGGGGGGELATTPSAGTGTAEAPANDLELVRRFYEDLPDAPASAFELLSPELLQSGLGEFLDAWSHVVAIDSLNVLQQADGVLATVRLRLFDGSHLRIQQLLTVAESPHRIVGVQLLSAQRN